MQKRTPFRRAAAGGLLASCLVLAIVLPTVRGRSAAASAAAAERSLLYMSPNNDDYSGIGAAVNDAHSCIWSKLGSSALKITHGKFDKFRPSDDTSWSYFPYSALKSYETTLGHPLYITATYAGKPRPVYWAWSLGSPAAGAAPTTASSGWEQAVNVADPAFVDFWVNQYVYPLMWKGGVCGAAPLTPATNAWMGVDEAAFTYDGFGVLDDNNHWVPCVTWDAPFPQSASTYDTMIETFFSALHQRYPGIHVMANLGTPGDWGQFQTLFANVDGIMLEDLLYGNQENPSAYTRLNFYNRLTNLSWFAMQPGKVMVERAELTPGSTTYLQQLRTEYMAYLMQWGPHSYFAPVGGSTYTEINPADYASIRAAVGDPTGTVVTTCSSPGYCLYRRNTTTGIVFINEMGSSQTVQLGGTYYDRTGNQATSITIPDAQGDFVSTGGAPGPASIAGGTSTATPQALTTATAAAQPTDTATPVPPTATGTDAAVPPTDTPTDAAVLLTDTPTAAAVPPTATGTDIPVLPTDTPTDAAVPPTDMPTATQTNIPVPTAMTGPASGTHSGYIATAGTSDSATFTPGVGGTTTVGLCAVTARNDYDLYVYDSAGTLLASSASPRNCEWVALRVSAGQTYTVKTTSYAYYSGTGTYRWAWSVSGAPVVWNVSGSIRSSGGSSYYSVPIVSTGPITVATCGPAGTDFNLYLQDAAYNTLAGSTAPSTCQSLSYTPSSRGLYRLKEVASSGTGTWTGTMRTG